MTSPAEVDLSFHLEEIKRNKAKQKIKPHTRGISTFSVSEVKFPEVADVVERPGQRRDSP